MRFNYELTKGLNICFVGEKTKHITYQGIDEIEIFSHANKFGNGLNHVSVGFSREKIKEFQNNIENITS